MLCNIDKSENFGEYDLLTPATSIDPITKVSLELINMYESYGYHGRVKEFLVNITF